MPPRRTRAARGCPSEEDKGLLGHGRRPAAEALERRVPDRAAAEALAVVGTPAGAHGVHDQARWAELVAHAGERGVEGIGITRVGRDPECAALADRRGGLLAPRDGSAAPALRLEVVEHRAAEVACAQHHRNALAGRSNQTMMRMISAIPTPTPVMLSGARFCLQKSGFAREAS